LALQKEGVAAFSVLLTTVWANKPGAGGVSPAVPARRLSLDKLEVYPSRVCTRTRRSPHNLMIAATQIRPGMVIKFNNDLHSIFSMVHRTPGNLRGFVQAKMRNLRNGSMIEHRFSSEDKVDRVSLDEQEMEYLYDDGEDYHFMNTETFEQMHLNKDLLGDSTHYLVANMKVAIKFYEAKAISVELPPSVELTVVETEPGLKGATVSNVTKPATLETGLIVQVPPFINQGERIRVSTSEGSYLERA
jgi:elongation factor P